MKQILKIGALIALPFGSALAAPFDDVVQSLPADLQDMPSFVATTPEVYNAVAWDAAGQVVFPPNDDDANNALIWDRIEELQALSQEAGPQGLTIPATRAPDRVFHCRSTPAVCVVLAADQAASAPPEPEYDAHFAYFKSAMGWFYVFIGLCVAFVVGFYFVVRSRPEIPLDPESFDVGPVNVHPSLRNCTVNGAEVALTARDITILRCFEGQPAGGVVTTEVLMDAGWGTSHRPDADDVKTHLAGLAAKLGTQGLFVQVDGQGYQITLPT